MTRKEGVECVGHSHGLKSEGIAAMYYDFDWKDAPFSSRSLPVVTGLWRVKVSEISP